MNPIHPLEPSFGQPDYSLALYPHPPSHDFLTWLQIADLNRRAVCPDRPLRVKFAFVDGQLGRYDFPFSLKTRTFDDFGGTAQSYSDQMIANVLRPAIAMIGAVEVTPLDLSKVTFSELETLCDGFVQYDYHIWQLVDAAKTGYRPIYWIPPERAFQRVAQFLQGERPIVITLRESEIQPERNSNLNSWIRFAGNLVNTNYPVLFVRDTLKADKWFPHRTYPEASQNAFIRAALYQSAHLNMLVSNGPVGWLQHSSAPFLCFKQLVPALPKWQHGSPIGWRQQAHLEVGDQYPWCSSVQRLTWTDDTYENLHAAFESIESLL